MLEQKRGHFLNLHQIAIKGTVYRDFQILVKIFFLDKFNVKKCFVLNNYSSYHSKIPIIEK